MSPNLFLCLRTMFCPTYWFQKGQRIDGNVKREQHWDSPVPGTYKFFPGKGWQLIRRDGSDRDEKVPQTLVYCRILHQYMFESELNDRCRWYKAPLHRGAAPEDLRFFLLDDGIHWVAGWDAQGRFIPGPYPKWYLDEDGETMHRGASPCSSANVSRRSSIIAGKFD
ncbi:hypothetical protein POX_d05032 [Penicillium oxalicum]|uniref:Uncharacterized protein n=1 Tax=Penicillium oxalicum (strain 114-2 / CGMCC 5302) TaxID=933388 RepID=S8BCZ5_PENO1|nr:hypothetical protein POX_d05032 [Penicillium oxalicum]EPS32817.1 hypothetical protein PDE_07777 [Penicillium oxalicum 114-2]KAI2789539.1 hypothetical protein POX_d05032 [Penicillium oxalicum]